MIPTSSSSSVQRSSEAVMEYDEADPAVGHYNDGNRAFLQALLARGTMTITEGKQLLAAIFTAQEGTENTENNVTQEDIDSYVSAAADAISPYDFEIRNTQHQISKKRIYSIVNSSSDALTQFATTKTPEEIAYIKRFLNAMFETYNTPNKEVMAVSGMQSTQGSLRKGAGRQEAGEDTQSVDKGVTVEQTEKLLGRMIKEGWLERSQAGYYTLAPRALMELRSWLVETYNEDDPGEWQKIKFCEACKEILTVGQRCSRRECLVRLHNICEMAYWNSRPAKKCPKCHTAWAGDRFVGEKVITTTEDYLRGKRRSGAGSKRAREEPEEADEEVEQPQRRQKSGRARGPVQAEESEEEGDAEEEGVDEDEEEEEEEEERRPAQRGRNAARFVQDEASGSDDEEVDEEGEDG